VHPIPTFPAREQQVNQQKKHATAVSPLPRRARPHQLAQDQAQVECPHAAKDNFQIITEHDQDSLIYDPSYLDIARTDGVIIIQITLNEGRTLEMKKAFFKAVAERLHKELGVRMEDVFIGLVEVKKENWSFGNGIAQYAP